MLNTLIIVVFYSIIATSLLVGILNLFQSNIYDFKQAKIQHKRKRHPFTRSLRHRPLVTVLVYSKNDANTIESCLKSLIKGSYRKIDIIVIDNLSTDNSKQVIQKFIKNHQRQSIRLINKKRASNRNEVVSSANRWIKGELVTVIDASCVLEKSALKNMVTELSNPDINVSLPNIQIDHDYRLRGLAGMMREIASIWNKKSGGFICPSQDAYNYAATYRSTIFNFITKPKRRSSISDINALRQNINNVVYVSQAEITGHKFIPTNFKFVRKSVLKFYLVMLTIVEPFIAVFMIYVAIHFHNPAYIILAWLTFTTLLILAIWTDESRSITSKIQISFLALVAYILHIAQLLAGLIRQLPFLTSKNGNYSGMRKFLPS